jgi:hypothetical protein
MKTLTIGCDCGGRCSTFLRIETDTEKPKNLYLSIKNEKYELASFVSLDREQSLEIVRYIKSKYKEG